MDPILNELVERLRENLGASAVIMDTEHQYTAEMEGFLLMVHHLEDSGQILLGTCVAPLPREGRERVLLALLQGQYFFQRTAGATLAVDNEASFIVLAGGTLPAPADGGQLCPCRGALHAGGRILARRMRETGG